MPESVPTILAHQIRDWLLNAYGAWPNARPYVRDKGIVAKIMVSAVDAYDKRWAANGHFEGGDSVAELRIFCTNEHYTVWFGNDISGFRGMFWGRYGYISQLDMAEPGSFEQLQADIVETIGC